MPPAVDAVLMVPGSAAWKKLAGQSLSVALAVQDASSRQGAAAPDAEALPQDTRGDAAQAPEPVSTPQRVSAPLEHIFHQ